MHVHVVIFNTRSICTSSTIVTIEWSFITACIITVIWIIFYFFKPEFISVIVLLNTKMCGFNKGQKQPKLGLPGACPGIRKGGGP